MPSSPFNRFFASTTRRRFKRNARLSHPAEVLEDRRLLSSVSVAASTDQNAANTTIIVGSQTPSKPVLTGPSGTVSSSTPTITWNAAANAVTYELLAYDVKLGREVIHQAGLPTTAYLPMNPLVNSRYQVFVRGVNASGQAGEWSAPLLFGVNASSQPLGVPQLTAPGAITADTTPTFQWQAASGAAAYELLVYDIDLGRQVLNGTNIVGTSFSSSLPPYKARYQAFVRAKDANGLPGGWSPSLEFEVQTISQLPGRPVVTTPAGATTVDPPTIRWQPAAGAATYDLLVYQVDRGVAVINAGGTTATSYTHPYSIGDGRFQVFVRGVNSAGQAGAWSTPWYFEGRTTSVPPAQPNWTGPAGDTVADATPEFAWSAVAGAATYEINVYDKPRGFRLYNEFLTSPSFTPPTDLPTNTTIQSFVRAIGASGQQGSWSNAIEFTISRQNVSKSYTTPEDTQLHVDAKGGLLAGITINGQPTIQLVDQPAYGALSISPDGAFSYTPRADAFGTEQLTYQVQTAAGTIEGNLEIELAPVNDAPRFTLLPQLALRQGSGERGVPLTAFDAEGNAVQLSASVVGGATVGTARVSDGSLYVQSLGSNQTSLLVDVTASDGVATTTRRLTVPLANRPVVVTPEGVIQIHGTARNDEVSLRKANSQIEITVKSPGEVFVGTYASSAPRIEFYGYAGDDRFDGNTIINAAPFLGYGDDGNDIIYGAGYTRNIINGGKGNDILGGQSGGDEIRGGDGDDLIYGFDGPDRLYGDAGQDSLFGGRGNDFLDNNNVTDGSVRLDAASRVLAVYGTQRGDVVEITGDAEIVVRHSFTGSESLERFQRSQIDRIVFRGYEGDDYFANRTSIPSLAYGDGGENTLRGGSGNDRLFAGPDFGDLLYGDGGDDDLRGSYGPDSIDAGAGNDYVFAAQGDDTVTGGSGEDTLHGSTGNDVLFGGEGNDTLYGYEGHDALFGGVRDKDELFGGDGKDRFLLHSDQNGDPGTLDFPQDFVESNDAKLWFLDKLEIKDVTKATAWTNREIEELDAGFATLFAETGNNVLLRNFLTRSNRTLYFGKHRTPTFMSGGINARAANTEQNGQRVIVLGEWNENRYEENQSRISTLIHEMAHTWDYELFLSSIQSFKRVWTNFLAQSGWTLTKPDTGNYVKSTDGSWWHRADAPFARDYGKRNPYEDWATTWPVYFNFATANENIDGKLNVVESLFPNIS